MGLVISLGLFAFMGHSFETFNFLLACVFMLASLPFFYDGAISMISAYNGRILMAAPANIEEEAAADEDADEAF